MTQIASEVLDAWAITNALFQIHPNANRFLQPLQQLKSEWQSKDFDHDEALSSLNTLVETCNKSLQMKAPFPTFSTEHGRSQTMEYLLAFELFLDGLIERGELSLSKESPIFQTTVKLWEAVESGNIGPKQGLAKLLGLIHETNVKLPEEFHFPSFNLDSYS